MRNRLPGAALILTVLLGACADASGPSLLSRLGQASFPPDRTAWQTAPLPVRAAHARALHAALEQGQDASAAWDTDTSSGTVRIDRLGPVKSTYCAAFTDTITIAGRTSAVRDAACWGDGWAYLRDPKAVPVLGPAFEQTDRVYTVRRGGTLRAVARRTRNRLADLRALNPAYPSRLPAGTKVLLP